jgi:hypothetical protein
VTADEYSAFRSELVKDLKNGRVPPVVERLADNAPVLVDFDIGGLGNRPKERVIVTSNLLKVLVKALQQAVASMVGPGHLISDMLRVVVLLRHGARTVRKFEQDTSTVSWKDGIHLMMPGVIMKWKGW